MSNWRYFNSRTKRRPYFFTSFYSVNSWNIKIRHCEFFFSMLLPQIRILLTPGKVVNMFDSFTSYQLWHIDNVFVNHIFKIILWNINFIKRRRKIIEILNFKVSVVICLIYMIKFNNFKFNFFFLIIFWAFGVNVIKQKQSTGN